MKQYLTCLETFGIRCIDLTILCLDVTQNYDCVFWSGDLNFRLTPPREEVMSWIAKQKFPLTTPSLGCLADQLTTSIMDGKFV